MQTPPKIMFQILNGTCSSAEPGSPERLQNMLANIGKNRLLQVDAPPEDGCVGDGPIYCVCVPDPGDPSWQISEHFPGDRPQEMTHYDFPCISEALH